MVKGLVLLNAERCYYLEVNIGNVIYHSASYKIDIKKQLLDSISKNTFLTNI